MNYKAKEIAAVKRRAHKCKVPAAAVERFLLIAGDNSVYAVNGNSTSAKSCSRGRVAWGMGGLNLACRYELTYPGQRQIVTIYRYGIGQDEILGHWIDGVEQVLEDKAGQCDLADREDPAPING